VHAAAVAFLLLGVKPAAPTPPVYAVELVAAPAPTQRRRLAPEAVPTPPQERPAPVESSPPEPADDAVPEPEPVQREPQEDREPAPETLSPMEPLPGETPSTGTDVANIKTPGLAFPYPEYLRNIVNQIYRRWGARNRPLRAEVSFLILRDGTIRDVRFVRRSGNFAFDLEAQGAIEAAANAGAFGPLPDGWPSDVLQISFFFEPRQQ
jgi:outer membrane biosynthesis protein TonB